MFPQLATPRSARLAKTYGGALAVALCSLGLVGAALADTPTTAEQGRAFVKELRSVGDQAGVRRAAKPKLDTPTSFSLVLIAAPFELAFYADHGDLLTPQPSQPAWKYGAAQFKFPDLLSGLKLPKAKGYGKHKPTASAAEYFERWFALGDKASKLPLELVRKAEVVRYTLDENDDGELNLDDRKGAESAKTSATDDNVLLRHVYGTRLGPDGAPAPVHESEVIVRDVRVKLDEKDAFDAQPKPLFVYTLSERFAQFDLNGDGDAEDELLFGDSDGDGVLSEPELQALYQGGNTSSLVGNLSLDLRFAAVTEGETPRASLLDRVKQQYKQFNDQAAKQFVLNAVVRADLSLLVEYNDAKRGARVRQHFGGAADFRNALMRTRGMTK